MRTNDQQRAEMSAILDEIERLQQALGPDARETEDREAFDVVSRIERKALANVAAA